jgi:hypothetical protein
MIDDKKAAAIDRAVRDALGVEPEAFRDWLLRRIVYSDESHRPITRVKMLRGSHGQRYVYDPNGTDVLPPGYQMPMQSAEAA